MLKGHDENHVVALTLFTKRGNVDALTFCDVILQEHKRSITYVLCSYFVDTAHSINE